MIDIESIYESFLQQESEKIQLRYKGVEDWFGASSAGQCYRKQWYRANKYEPTPPDKRVNRLLRLGTIVHSDFEKAVSMFSEVVTGLPQQPQWITEHQIRLPVLKVVGHLDIALIDHEESKAYLWDIKTVHSFKWKKQFGHMKNVIEPEELKPGITPGVPVQEWECRYCQFAKHCDSPFKR
jgi:CRISPR/Cas system-associated exonuclease Cas4 (RecB family)